MESDQESLTGSDQGNNGKLIEITARGKEFSSCFVEMDNEIFVRSQDGDEEIDSLVSSGFASCVATAIRTISGNYLFLSHNSLATTVIDDYINFVQSVKQEMIDASSSNQVNTTPDSAESKKRKTADLNIPDQEIDVTVGFAWHSNFVGVFSECFQIITNQSLRHNLDNRNLGTELQIFAGDYSDINNITEHYSHEARELHKFINQKIKDANNLNGEKSTQTEFVNLLDDALEAIEMVKQWALNVKNRLEVDITNLPNSTILVPRVGKIILDIDQGEIDHLLLPSRQEEMSAEQEISDENSCNSSQPSPSPSKQSSKLNQPQMTPGI